MTSGVVIKKGSLAMARLALCVVLAFVASAQANVREAANRLHAAEAELAKVTVRSAPRFAAARGSFAAPRQLR